VTLQARLDRPRDPKTNFVRRHPGLVAALAAALLAAVFLWVLFVFGHALPPRRIVMTTGPEGGAYRELGEKYRRFLARSGIDLQLRASLGNVDNLQRLKDPKAGVSVGLVSGGLTTPSESPGVVSLGTIAYDPLWIFCRGIPEPIHFQDLRGKKVSIGPEGGGTRPLVLELLRANKMEKAIEALTLSPGPSGDALLRGELDCACMVTTAEAPVVRRLLADDRVSLVSFELADAYTALYPYLRKVVLPAGVADLSTRRPPSDITLIASASSLVVREDLHPALQFLLLQAADEIHSPAGLLHKPDQFPAPEPVDLSLSSEAKPFYKSGGSYLQRHLPFWLWVFASRLLLILIPLVGIAYPLFQIVPDLVGTFVRRRLNRLYAELREIEERLETAGADTSEVASALNRLEDKVGRTRVPSFHARALYTLKHHVGLVRERLARA
jgi:TRAP-type uncharacterized transport system substrate-binding protein